MFGPEFEAPEFHRRATIETTIRGQEVPGTKSGVLGRQVLEAITLRLEPIALRVEAMNLRLEAIAIGLECLVDSQSVGHCFQIRHPLSDQLKQQPTNLSGLNCLTMSTRSLTFTYTLGPPCVQ